MTRTNKSGTKTLQTRNQLIFALGQVLYEAAVLEANGVPDVGKQIVLFGVSLQRAPMFALFESLCERDTQRLEPLPPLPAGDTASLPPS